MEKICKNCRHYHCGTEKCRIFPPTLVLDTKKRLVEHEVYYSYKNKLPDAAPDFWCGQWQFIGDGR